MSYQPTYQTIVLGPFPRGVHFTFYMCESCGALVKGIDQHNAFHERISNG